MLNFTINMLCKIFIIINLKSHISQSYIQYNIFLFFLHIHFDSILHYKNFFIKFTVQQYTHRRAQTLEFHIQIFFHFLVTDTKVRENIVVWRKTFQIVASNNKISQWWVKVNIQHDHPYAYCKDINFLLHKNMFRRVTKDGGDSSKTNVMTLYILRSFSFGKSIKWVLCWVQIE